MAPRRKRIDSPTTGSEGPQELSGPAEQSAGPSDGAPVAPGPDGETPPAGDHPAEPAKTSRGRRAGEKLRSALARYFPGKKIELIDDGNAGGLGIKFTYDDPAERPSDEVKQILKDGDEQRPGFSYQGSLKQWRKRIGADAGPQTAVAIRLDAERRFAAVAEQMSHEERLKADRERGGEAGDKTPF
jgi:hypothetical protein